jgi:amiloride-sensitive sodium channel
MGYTKEEYKELEKVIYEIMDPKLTKEEKEDLYNYDVEDFLLRVIFHNLYNYGSMSSYCLPYIDCDDNCLKCPMSGYQQFADRVRANCEKLFHECKWNDKPFDCCKHFQPVRTTLGTCYILNSIQVANHSKFWIDMKAGMREGNGHLELTVTKSSALYILNEEDIPHMLLTTLQFPQIPDGYDGEILVGLKNLFLVLKILN